MRMKKGMISWKPEYKYQIWDLKNYCYVWEKAMDDVLTDVGFWPDDDVLTLVGGSIGFTPVDDINDRKLVYTITEL